jgi:hypothetical protein
MNNRREEKMRTMKVLVWAAIALLVCTGPVWAQSMDFELNAGSSSLAGGIFYERALSSGYMKYGISGVYSDDDDTDYQWGAFQVLVGSDTLTPGLRAEVGFKALYGSAEDHIYSGDIGAIAFTGRVGYLLTTPLPLELFGGLSYAPGPLTFLDADAYSELTLGIGLRLIQQASIEISYHAYNVDMDEGPGSWNLDENAVRFGIRMSF